MVFSKLMPPKFSTRLFLIVTLSGLVPTVIFAYLIRLFTTQLAHEIANAIRQGQAEQWLRSDVLRDLLANFHMQGVVLMGVSCVLLLLLASWVGGYFSRTLTQLREATRRINQGSLDVRVQPIMTGDVGELVQDFNNMVAQLKATTVSKERLQASEEQLKAANRELRRQISERERTEDALRNSMSTNRALLDAIPDILFRIKKDGRFANYKPAAEGDEWGITSSGELIGKHASEVFPPDVSQPLLDSVQQTLHTNTLHAIEFQLAKHGGMRTYEARTVVSWNDETLTIIRDITERKDVEASLQQAKDVALEAQRAAEAAQRASEAANRAKSEFLAHMSHELRTPLNGILGYAQILRHDLTLGEQQRDAIHTIHASGEHLLLMINDTLDLSKIEAQKMDLRPTDIHLLRFLKSIEEIIRIRAQQQRIVFDCKLGHDLPIGIHADEKRLRQVLLNLLGNAVKFTPQGRVVFRVMVRSASTPLNPGYENPHLPSPDSDACYTRLRFQVDDSGIGIPADNLVEIFKPFHQIADVRVTTEGTGLGLAISQRLVRLMGGELHVDSTAGHGSTFWFDLDLPVVADLRMLADTRLTSRNIIGYHGRPRRILIVDDQPTSRRMFVKILGILGFETAEAENGKQALEYAPVFQPDLILMDLRMPLMNGFEATQQLRQDPRLKDIVVIAISASMFSDVRQESLAAGCDDFLTKPVQMDDLLDCLRIHLKLEWRYNIPSVEDASAAPEPPVLKPPSQDALRDLFTLAMRGDVLLLQERARALESGPPATAAFGTRLHELAKALQIDTIQEFIADFMEADE